MYTSHKVRRKLQVIIFLCVLFTRNRIRLFFLMIFVFPSVSCLDPISVELCSYLYTGFKRQHYRTLNEVFTFLGNKIQSAKAFIFWKGKFRCYKKSDVRRHYFLGFARNPIFNFLKQTEFFWEENFSFCIQIKSWDT